MWLWLSQLVKLTLRDHTNHIFRQGSEETSPTNILLQNLLKRPDVRSTLILSRKDGSIIKAAGLIAEDSNELQVGRTNPSLENTEEHSAEQDRGDEARMGVAIEEGKSRAQMLASSIFHFVASATTVSASLNEANHASSAMPSGNDRSNEKGTTKNKTPARDDIQLLRLRLSKQEVIIFPDPSYLCCVVQEIDKNWR